MLTVVGSLSKLGSRVLSSQTSSISRATWSQVSVPHCVSFNCAIGRSHTLFSTVRSTSHRYSASESGEKRKPPSYVPKSLYHWIAQEARKDFWPDFGKDTPLSVIGSLARFGPFASWNPLFLSKLLRYFRAYGSVALVSSVLITSLLTSRDLDARMALAATSTGLWGQGEWWRMFTSMLYHPLPTFFISSGVLLALATTVEVAAGPLTLLSLVLAVASTSHTIALFPQMHNMYMENASTGIFPVILGLMGFIWTGIRNATPHYINHNPNIMDPEARVWERRLVTTIPTRGRFILAAAVYAYCHFRFGYLMHDSFLAAFTGSCLGLGLGWMYRSSPHLALAGCALSVATSAYWSLRPTVLSRSSLVQFAKSWEEGDFETAYTKFQYMDRAWQTYLRASPSEVGMYHPETSAWMVAIHALSAMAAGHTATAEKLARTVKVDQLLTKDQFKETCTSLEKELGPAVLAEGHLTPEVRHKLTTELKGWKQELPWLIANDEKIIDLYQQVFYSDPPLSPVERQELIALHYQGLFNLDINYGDLQRGCIVALTSLTY